MANVEFDTITPKLGAYVRISADRMLNENVPGQICDALNNYGVLVFPQLNLDDDTFITFTNALGSMRPAIHRDGSGAYEKGIYRVSLDKDDKTQREFVLGNDWWHMDGTNFRVPGKATLLKCESPPSQGGETDFANLFAAYEALSENQKQKIKDLRVIHCMASVGRKLYDTPTEDDFARWETVFPPTEHPLVWHQKSGRTSLVVGSTAYDIVGMPHEKGYALLQEILEWCTQDEFTYRHIWQKGDLVMFNNPGLLHRSQPYEQSSGRLLHRTTLDGSEEIA